MSGTDVHFEVFFKKTRKDAWKLIEAFPGRDDAIAAAKSLMGSAPDGSVRVSKETYDEASATFNGVTVFSEGGDAFKHPKRDEPPELPCQGPADLFKGHARETMARALGGWLGRANVVPLELLHRPDLVEKLEASDTELQHAVQKVALAHASSTGGSGPHFVKTLNKLVQQLIEKVHVDARKRKTPTLKAGHEADTFASMGAQADRETQVNAALAFALKKTTDWEAKLTRLLEIAEGVVAGGKDTAWALEPLGEFLAEVMAVRAAQGAFTGKGATLGDELNALTDVFAGVTDGPGVLSPVGETMARFFRKKRFKDARNVLARRILADLKGNKRLYAQNFDAEVELNRSLAERLIMHGVPMLSVEDISEAFVIRSGRLLEPDAIQGYLSTCKDPHEQLQRLVALEDNIVGDHNKRKLASYVRGQLGTHVVERHYCSGDAPPLTRIAAVAEIAQGVAKAGFDAADKLEIAGKLDTLTLEIDQRGNVLEGLWRRKGPPLDVGIGLLRLVARGVFPEGRLREDAIGKAKLLIASPAARQVLEAGGAETVAKAKELGDLMRVLSAEKKAA